MRRRARIRCSTSSRTTESIPPLKAVATRSPGRTTPASCAATRAATPCALPPEELLLRFLELAITDELLEPCFQQLVDRLVFQLAPCFLERLAQILQHYIVIAMRPAGRLVDDAVDETERLQPGRRDAERL